MACRAVLVALLAVAASGANLRADPAASIAALEDQEKKLDAQVESDALAANIPTASTPPATTVSTAGPAAAATATTAEQVCQQCVNKGVKDCFTPEACAYRGTSAPGVFTNTWSAAFKFGAICNSANAGSCECCPQFKDASCVNKEKCSIQPPASIISTPTGGAVGDTLRPSVSTPAGVAATGPAGVPKLELPPTGSQAPETTVSGSSKASVTTSAPSSADNVNIPKYQMERGEPCPAGHHCLTHKASHSPEDLEKPYRIGKTAVQLGNGSDVDQLQQKLLAEKTEVSAKDVEAKNAKDATVKAGEVANDMRIKSDEASTRVDTLEARANAYAAKHNETSVKAKNALEAAKVAEAEAHLQAGKAADNARLATEHRQKAEQVKAVLTAQNEEFARLRGLIRTNQEKARAVDEATDKAQEALTGVQSKLTLATEKAIKAKRSLDRANEKKRNLEYEIKQWQLAIQELSRRIAKAQKEIASHVVTIDEQTKLHATHTQRKQELESEKAKIHQQLKDLEAQKDALAEARTVLLTNKTQVGANIVKSGTALGVAQNKAAEAEKKAADATRAAQDAESEKDVQSEKATAANTKATAAQKMADQAASEKKTAEATASRASDVAAQADKAKDDAQAKATQLDKSVVDAKKSEDATKEAVEAAKTLNALQKEHDSAKSAGSNAMANKDEEKKINNDAAASAAKDTATDAKEAAKESENKKGLQAVVQEEEQNYKSQKDK